jgi:hypothetical protein
MEDRACVLRSNQLVRLQNRIGEEHLTGRLRSLELRGQLPTSVLMPNGEHAALEVHVLKQFGGTQTRTDT